MPLFNSQIINDQMPPFNDQFNTKLNANIQNCQIFHNQMPPSHNDQINNKLKC
jgi:hypothetical protein